MPVPLITCPICAAAVAATEKDRHIAWHVSSGTKGTSPAVAGPGRPDDDAPTAKFPPISETVLRRPPPVPVRELRGPELLRALAEEIERDLEADEREAAAGDVCGECGHFRSGHDGAGCGVCRMEGSGSSPECAGFLS